MSPPIYQVEKYFAVEVPVGEGRYLTFGDLHTNDCVGTLLEPSIKPKMLYRAAEWDEGVVVGESDNGAGTLRVEIPDKELLGGTKVVEVEMEDVEESVQPGDYVEAVLTDFETATVSPLGLEGSLEMPTVSLTVDGKFERFNVSTEALCVDAEDTATNGRASAHDPWLVGRPNTKVVPKFYGPQPARVVSCDPQASTVVVVILDRSDKKQKPLFKCQVSRHQIRHLCCGAVVRHKYGTKWQCVTVSKIHQYKKQYEFSLGAETRKRSVHQLVQFDSGTLVDVTLGSGGKSAGILGEGTYGAIVVGEPSTMDGTYVVKCVHEMHLRHAVDPQRMVRRSRKISPGARVNCTLGGAKLVGTVQFCFPDGTCAVVEDGRGPSATLCYVSDGHLAALLPEEQPPPDYRPYFSEACGGYKALVKTLTVSSEALKKLENWSRSKVTAVEAGTQFDVRLFGSARSAKCTVRAVSVEHDTFDGDISIGNRQDRFRGLTVDCIEAGLRTGQNATQGVSRRIVVGSEVVVQVHTWTEGVITQVHMDGTYTVKHQGRTETGVTEACLEVRGGARAVVVKRSAYNCRSCW